MLHVETLSQEMWELLQKLMKDEKLSEFNLVGGTNLGLVLGHRISYDMDLFTTKDFDSEGMLDHLKQRFEAEVRYKGKNTLMINLDNIKVDLIAHKFDLQKPIKTIDNIRLTSLEDIGAMKLHAIFQNGTRLKDFVDMYYLLERHSLKTYLQAYEKKYDANPALASYALTYFDNIIREFNVMMIKGKENKWSIISTRLKDATLNPSKLYGKLELVPPKKGKGLRR